MACERALEALRAAEAELDSAERAQARFEWNLAAGGHVASGAVTRREREGLLRQVERARARLGEARTAYEHASRQHRAEPIHGAADLVPLDELRE